MAVYKITQKQLRDAGAAWGTIPAETLEDMTLSAEAHRLLMWMLAKPPLWDFNIENIAASFGAGRRSVSRWMHELRKAQYVDVTKLRFPKLGTWDWSYTVYPLPLPRALSVVSGAPSKNTGVDTNVIDFPEQSEG